MKLIDTKIFFFLWLECGQPTTLSLLMFYNELSSPLSNSEIEK